MAVIIKIRRDTAADWTASDPVLALGEVGIETDTTASKTGDGVTSWSGLPYDLGNAKKTPIDTLTVGTDITTLNATNLVHGLVVKAVPPAANVLAVVAVGNGETAYTCKDIFDATNPAALGTAAPGTAVVAAHRDHVHAWPTALSTTSALASDHIWSGLSSIMTAGENLTYGQTCYLKSDGKLWLSDADAAASMPVIAIVADAAGIAAEATGNFLLHGFIRHDAWNWTVPNLLYADITTAGGLTKDVPTGAGDQVQIVAQVLTADCIYFNPSFVVVEVA